MDRVEQRFAFRSVGELPIEPDDDEIVTIGGPLPHVEHVEVIGPLLLSVRFDDGIAGTVRFEPSYLNGAFAKLNDAGYFARVGVAYGAVSWPNEEPDLCPDVMHDAIKANGEWVLR